MNKMHAMLGLAGFCALAGANITEAKADDPVAYPGGTYQGTRVSGGCDGGGDYVRAYGFVNPGYPVGTGYPNANVDLIIMGCQFPYTDFIRGTVPLPFLSTIIPDQPEPGEAYATDETQYFLEIYDGDISPRDCKELGVSIQTLNGPLYVLLHQHEDEYGRCVDSGGDDSGNGGGAIGGS